LRRVRSAGIVPRVDRSAALSRRQLAIILQRTNFIEKLESLLVSLSFTTAVLIPRNFNSQSHSGRLRLESRTLPLGETLWVSGFLRSQIFCDKESGFAIQFCLISQFLNFFNFHCQRFLLRAAVSG
jgi:hypothetical protein